MELLKEVREKFENMDLKDEVIYRGLHEALTIVDQNSDVFINHFPRPSSVNNIYPAILNGGEWDDWTSGFWTGILWLAYEITLEEKYRKVADYQLKTYKERIDNNIAVDHHDLGFLYIPSVIANYKITNSEVAKETGIKAADVLMRRYREKGEFIQAWGVLDKPEDYRLIIDCNLNVPLLFWASDVTGDMKYREVATKHLETVSKVIVRDNGTTFHTYFFDTETGNPLKGVTAQGKSDDSTWARGQAWGVYGFALAYRHLGDKKFIDLYKKVTNTFLNKLPKDNVCYWDMDFKPEDMEERDSSSSAIAACGILEMHKYLPDDDPDKKVYFNAAMAMIKALIEGYTTKGMNSNAILKEAVYSKPHNNGVGESCIWGDYFYMEALVRILKPEWNIYW
ncbi:glycoside hydrolase family 88 protein [Streptobacillus felis]|uniref:Glycoside hydrolase family 88 protein n=1 Tax=Streptobacillus felis TaxID=1384509 RepID=A0A7Z0TAQ2_9FUSO|nr:glycoside hydrolase family 88 protein [Streptobacillus felis]NYV28250.1 glycoside hydrolase family 88 protein [Streptobacillus felis]